MRQVQVLSFITVTLCLNACGGTPAAPTGTMNNVGMSGATATGTDNGGADNGTAGTTADPGGTTATGTSGSSATGTGGSGPSTGGDGPVTGTDMPGDATILVGTFTLTLVEENAATTPPTPALSQMQGYVRDAAATAGMVWDTTEEDGACKLQVPRFPACDPECGGDQTCVDENTCANDPLPKDVGTVTVTGLNTETDVAEVALNPIGASSNYSVSGGVRIEYPPTAEGAEVRLVSEGGDYDPFAITAKGIAPLEVTTEEPVPFAPDTATTLEWTPAGAAGDSKISVLVDISHHGGAKGRILCEDVPDTGSLEISGDFIGQLIDLGTAGGPTVRVIRESVGSTTIEVGRVDFLVTQSQELNLDVPGLITCNDTLPCPEGQTCAATQQCVEE